MFYKLTSKHEVESHFLSLLSFLGLGILDPGDNIVGVTWPGTGLTIFRLGLGARGGLGLVPVNMRPGGDEASLWRPGLCDGRHGVDLPDDGRD